MRLCLGKHGGEILDKAKQCSYVKKRESTPLKAQQSLSASDRGEPKEVTSSKH